MYNFIEKDDGKLYADFIFVASCSCNDHWRNQARTILAKAGYPTFIEKPTADKTVSRFLKQEGYLDAIAELRGSPHMVLINPKTTVYVNLIKGDEVKIIQGIKDVYKSK